MFFGDFAGGLEAFLHPANGVGATFFHRPL